MANQAWLRYLAERAGRELEHAQAAEIVRWATAAFGDRLVVTSSMTDGAVIHLVAQAAPGVEVLFLDTGYHFAETLGTRDAVASVYPVRVRSARPEQTVAEQDATYGPRLYERDPDLCCALRKVRPLDRALAGYTAWITGLRRSDSPERAGTPVVAFDERRGMVKVNPIAGWSDEEHAAYLTRHGTLTNPLLQLGYVSIGCAPCTRRTLGSEQARAGRWAGTEKTECGIHS